MHPLQSYTARSQGELTAELNLNTKLLTFKQGFTVIEEISLLQSRLPDITQKDVRLLFQLKNQVNVC